jgi:hypothetical protein
MCEERKDEQKGVDNGRDIEREIKALERVGFTVAARSSPYASALGDPSSAR